MRLFPALIILSSAASAPVLAACPPLAWNDAKTAAPSADDMTTLRCWSDGGSAEAGFMLAMLTKAGRGAAADPYAARKMLLTLAKGRSGDSMLGALSSRTEGYAIDSFGQAQRAVNLPPYAPAMRELAKMLLLGQGGDRDIPEAKAWLQKARGQDKEAAVLLDALEKKGI